MLVVGHGLVAESCLTLVTPWIVTCQAPLSMGFCRQEYWNGFPFPAARTDLNQMLLTFVFRDIVSCVGQPEGQA